MNPIDETTLPLNAWTRERLDLRREQGRALAKHHFKDDSDFALWENRTICLAQGTSTKLWKSVQHLNKLTLMRTIEGMIRAGAPFDEPYESGAFEIKPS